MKPTSDDYNRTTPIPKSGISKSAVTSKVKLESSSGSKGESLAETIASKTASKCTLIRFTADFSNANPSTKVEIEAHTRRSLPI